MRYTNELWGRDKENQKEKIGYVVVVFLFTILHIPDSDCSCDAYVTTLKRQ
jgi:hypothetical protein